MEQAAAKGCANIAVSVVSHGHDHLLPGLLRQIAETGAGCIARVVLTHNLPPRSIDTEAALVGSWPFELIEIVNPAPAGFGRNHNRAAEQAGDCALLAIVNPDVAWSDADLWKALQAAAMRTDIGCAFPRLMNTDGSVQDQVRGAVTPWALVRRRLLHRADTHSDWVSAAFWMVPLGVFRQMRGFDERFHMYCEDVDFCLRLQLRGWLLQGVPEKVVHDASRASHRDPRHSIWHVRSLLRLWCGSVLWRFVWRRKAARLTVRIAGDKGRTP